MSWKVQPPGLVRKMFPGTTWRKTKGDKTIYLTFDDGPVEKETSWVMDLLKQYGIQATFFCVGENAHRNQYLVQELLSQGHSVGNHAYNHLPAWKCSRKEYFENLEKAQLYIPGKLFRPPHGQLYPWYISQLKQMFKEVIMWDVLSMDYDKRLTNSEVVNNVLNHTRDGSILVFHDSKKAWDRMNYALPKSLDKLLELGYKFEAIEMG